MRKIAYPLMVYFCGLLLPLVASAQTFSHIDILPGPGASNPYDFIEYNNKLYFGATDSVHGYELWVSDGTANGTYMLKDIWPGSASSDLEYFTLFNNKL